MRHVLLLVVALTSACGRPAPVPRAAEAPPQGAWRSFEGTWTATGERHALDAGRERPATILAISGSLLLTGERGLGVGFQAQAVAFSDGGDTAVGRAVWTDEGGDRIFSDLRGAPVATRGRVVGTITGGTGRWSGITGTYELEWSYVVESEERVQGRAVGLRGRARIGSPEGGTR